MATYAVSFDSFWDIEYLDQAMVEAKVKVRFAPDYLRIAASIAREFNVAILRGESFALAHVHSIRFPVRPAGSIIRMQIMNMSPRHAPLRFCAQISGEALR
jgi:hypothetical protein